MSQVIVNGYGTIPEMLRKSSDRRCDNFFGYPDTKGWKFCALGTLAHNAGENPVKIMFAMHNKRSFYSKYGVDYTSRKEQVKCSICGAKVGKLRLIPHLNDNHQLKWGEIADILENTKSYDLTQPKINQFLDTLKDMINQNSNFQKSILEKIDNKFRK